VLLVLLMLLVLLVLIVVYRAYNHHHDTAVRGKGTHLEKVHMSDPRAIAAKERRNFIRLDHDMVWLPVEHEPSASGAPTSAMFSDGNGGEYRKSMHTYAPPFAQLVESPVELAGSPMQIDTWNRDKMPTVHSPFVSGPVPKLALAPTIGREAIYSGLLECPLTSRIEKLYAPGAASFDNFRCADAAAVCCCDCCCAHSLCC